MSSGKNIYSENGVLGKIVQYNKPDRMLDIVSNVNSAGSS